MKKSNKNFHKRLAIWGAMCYNVFIKINKITHKEVIGYGIY